MKKVFSKEIWKKFLASIMVILSLMWVMPERVHAKTFDIGGELMEPVIDLFVGIGDGAVNIVHRVVKNEKQTLFRFGEQTKTRQLINALGNIAGVLFFPYVMGAVGLGMVLKQATTLVIGETEVVKDGNGAVGITAYDIDDIDEDILVLPLYTVTPEEIFGGTLGMFNVNFFDTTLKKSSNTMNTTDSDETNIAEELQGIIAAWYKIIRGICIVGMLSMLVYIGIRILMSSTAENKAKYKQLLVDWGVGLCLLFVLHYGMAFGNMFVDSLTDVITSVKLGSNVEIDSNGTYTVEDIKSVNKTSQTLLIPKSKLEDHIEKDGDKYYLKIGDEKGEQPLDIQNIKIDKQDGSDPEEVEFVVWNTGLMGKLRVDVSVARQTSDGYIGYSLLFMVMVFFLVFFTWTYLKRVLYMAFLTLVAPFVALTYPLDKIKDGQAQAFNFWMKEYIYNLLLQPLHLLLYTVLVTSAAELATKHIIYSIVALGFLVPAEKLIRQMFGFKGNTPGLLPGPAGAALIMTGMKNLLAKAPDEKDNSINVPKADSKAKMKDVDYNAILGNGASVPVVNTPLSGAGSTGAGSSGTGSTGTGSTGTGSTGTGSTGTGSTGTGSTGTGSTGTGSTGTGSTGTGSTGTGSAGTGSAGTGSAGTGSTGTRSSGAIPITPQNYSFLRRAGRGTLRALNPLPVASQVGGNVKRKFANKVRKMKPRRFIAGAALGAVGAGIGLAAGITTGDAGKALTYASAGALAGNKAGRGIDSVFGVDEAIRSAQVAQMDPIERRQYERNKFMDSEEYALQRATEDRKYRKILDTKMADGRTIREAAIDSGFSHSDQIRIAKYALDDNNKDRFKALNDKNTKKAQNEKMAQDLFDEVDNTRKASNVLGVTNFDVLDSKTKQSKMEYIAKTVDEANYKDIKAQKKALEEQKAAVGQGGGMTDKQIAKERLRLQKEIEKKEKEMVAANTTKMVVQNINTWGKTED